MRQSFDQNTPISDQISRKSGMKQKGHKHNKSPGNKAINKKKASASRVMQADLREFRKRKQKISDYWAGKIDNYPQLNK